MVPNSTKDQWCGIIQIVAELWLANHFFLESEPPCVLSTSPFFIVKHTKELRVLFHVENHGEMVDVYPSFPHVISLDFVPVACKIQAVRPGLKEPCKENLNISQRHMPFRCHLAEDLVRFLLQAKIRCGVVLKNMCRIETRMTDCGWKSSCTSWETAYPL